MKTEVRKGKKRKAICNYRKQGSDREQFDTEIEDLRRFLIVDS